MKIGVDYMPPVFFGALRMFLGAAFIFAVVKIYDKIRAPVMHRSAMA